LPFIGVDGDTWTLSIGKNCLADSSPALQARHDQMFPVLEAHDIARLKRFGTPQTWPAGSAIF